MSQHCSDVFSSLLEFLSVIADPRGARGKRCPLIEILCIAVLGCVCGCDDIEPEREELLSRKKTTETRYYISSRELTPDQALHDVRNHWRVENQLHWCLDVIFGQDDNTTRTNNAAENLGIVRHIAINLVRNYTGERYSMPRRRRLCDYKPDYRDKLLGLKAAALRCDERLCDDGDARTPHRVRSTDDTSYEPNRGSAPRYHVDASPRVYMVSSSAAWSTPRAEPGR